MTDYQRTAMIAGSQYGSPYNPKTFMECLRSAHRELSRHEAKNLSKDSKLIAQWEMSAKASETFTHQE